MAWQSKRQLREELAQLKDLSEQERERNNQSRAALREQRSELLAGIEAFFKLNPRMADAYMVESDMHYGGSFLDIDKFLLDCREEVAENERSVTVIQRKDRLKSGKLEERHG